MAALTDVQICNIAQQKLGEEHIGDIAAPRTATERRYSLLYPHYRDVELRARRWRFALNEDVLLTLLAGRTDDTDYPFRYGMPANALRLVRDKFDRWKQVGDEVWSGEAGTLKVDVIRSDVAPGRFDSNFTEVLACRLAIEAAPKTKQSAALVERLSAQRIEALRVAGQVNAFIAGPETYGEDDSQYSWLTERYL